MVYETLNSVQDLQIVESANPNEVRLSGVFGVCNVKNNNNRIYNKDNYGKMVEALQQVIASEGCPGELEHPNTMNITLENVSHKIESIEMNADGTITGTVLLLNTPKGQIAKAIVEGGLPLYISSRGAGSIDESGHVTLSTIKTYDLVGTPGFSQAKLTLKKNQALECLNESLEDGDGVGAVWAIVESDDDDDLLGGAEKDDADEKHEEKHEEKHDEKHEKHDDPEGQADGDNKDDENKDNKDISNETTMKEIKDSIDALIDKVNNLEAELHIAQESLEDVRPVNYNAIQEWVTDEFAETLKESVRDSLFDDINTSVNEAIASKISVLGEGIQNWVMEEFAPEIEKWVCEEFAPEVQNWVCEEFAPEVQNWVCEEFAPEVQNWVCEEFAPEVEGWVTEEFAPVVEGWINEEFRPDVEGKINENVSQFMEAQKSTKLSEIDALLESIDNKDTDAALTMLKESYAVNNKYQGIYCVENMPAEYRPVFEGLTDDKKDEIIRSSRMYDFTKEGVLESFWANVNMEEKSIKEQLEQKTVDNSYYAQIARRMQSLR